MRALDELIPGICRPWLRELKWPSNIQEISDHYDQAVVEHYKTVQVFKDEATLMALAAVVADERKRIDDLESKARLVLSMMGVLMAIVLFVVRYLPVTTCPIVAGALATMGFIISVLYFGIGLIYAAAGVQLSMRWFLDSKDLTQASNKVKLVVGTVNEKALLAADSLAGREIMAKANLQKQNAIDVALRHMRNGIVCLGLSVILVLVMWFTGLPS